MKLIYPFYLLLTSFHTTSSFQIHSFYPRSPHRSPTSSLSVPSFVRSSVFSLRERVMKDRDDDNEEDDEAVELTTNTGEEGGPPMVTGGGRKQCTYCQNHQPRPSFAGFSFSLPFRSSLSSPRLGWSPLLFAPSNVQAVLKRFRRPLRHALLPTSLNRDNRFPRNCTTTRD